MDSYIPLLLAFLFFLADFLMAAISTDDTPGILHAKRLRNLRLLMLICTFFGVLFLMIFLNPFIQFQNHSFAGFVLVLLLLCLEEILRAQIMAAASKKRRPWMQAASEVLMNLTGWITSWIALPEKTSASESETKTELADEIDHEEEALDVAENALDLNEKTLDEICTHRSDVISIDVNDDPEKWKQIILDNRHTFYPVYNEGEEDIVGILDTRDYFRLKDGHSKKSILDHTLDQPFFVAENTTADELLHQMKKRKNYFAVVLDEYGGMTGIVTLHDILEELLGEITEAEDAIRPADIVRLPRGLWRISGSADLEEVSKALGEHLELDDFETFSGFILGTLGYIPEDGTQLEAEIGDLLIQITSIKNHRIRQTLVRKKQETQNNPVQNQPASKPAQPPRRS